MSAGAPAATWARAPTLRSGPSLQQRRAGGVVAMAVGDDDARDALARDRRQQRVEMGRVGRTGIMTATSPSPTM